MTSSVQRDGLRVSGLPAAAPRRPDGAAAAPAPALGSDDLIELLFFAYRDFVGDPDRILAAYGGVFVAGSLAWGMVVDGFRPDRYDVIGAVVCLVGVGIIMYSPRAS